MTHSNVCAFNISSNIHKTHKEKVELVDKYLGHTLRLGNETQKIEMSRRKVMGIV